MAADEAPPHTGPLAEFTALRAEIDRRSASQWTVVTVQIGIAGAVFGFALSGRHRELLLLVIPFATYMTLARYVSQMVHLKLIGRYIRTELSPRVPGGLGWEEWRLTNLRPSDLSVFGRLHLAWTVFPAVSVLAIGAFVLSALRGRMSDGQAWYTVASVVAVLAAEVLLTVGMGVVMLRVRRDTEGMGWAKNTSAQP
jgi:hypothetical protein